MTFNAAQSRHLAATLRAYGLGQFAVFGYSGIQLNHGLVVAVSAVFAAAAELGAIMVLNGVEDNA